MLRIGLTGGIGSGKTTACRIFSALDIPVYNSDDRAKHIMAHDESVVREIKSFMGEEAYSEGRLDRRYIASRVFTDKTLLKQLNAAVHPTVIRDFNKWAERFGAGDIPYIIQENAILFEGGFDKGMDYTITISAPEEERIARASERDGSNPEQIRARINNQMTDQAREQLADFILMNGEHDLLVPQVLTLHHKLSGLSRNHR